MEYNIVVSTNERYMPGAIVATVSVAVNAKPESRLRFHVFTENVMESSFNMLVFAIKKNHSNSEVVQYKMTDAQLEGLPCWAESRMAAARCLYAELMPDVDWCLYLDCDVLYLASIEEHFSYCDENKLALVSKEQAAKTVANEVKWILEEHGVKVSGQEYFNSGVMLFNFKRMREENISNKLLDFFKKHSTIPSPDQDALNAVMVGRTVILPAKWNLLQIYLNDSALSERPVIHYVSGIPWLPRLGAVANGRFRLWHAFADKYIWCKRGESCRRLFSFRILVSKYLLFYIIRMPIVGWMFCRVLSIFNIVKNPSSWRQSQVGCDIKRKGV